MKKTITSIFCISILNISLAEIQYNALITKEHNKYTREEWNPSEPTLPDSPYDSHIFVNTDVTTSGDKLAVLDTKTGLEWLNLKETYNNSYSDVTSRLLSDLEGWRYPTESEVLDFHSRILGNTNLYLTRWTDSYSGSVSNTDIQNYTNIIERTYRVSSGRSYKGAFKQDDNSSQCLSFYVSTTVYSGISGYDVCSYDDNGSSNYGFYLISTGVTLSAQENPGINSPVILED